MSQIDGDNFVGYDLIGLYAGLRGSMRLGEKMQMRVELLYSQKGSKFESTEGAKQGEKDRHIKLNYAEIPILFAYRINRVDAKNALWLEGGISLRSGEHLRGRSPHRQRPFKLIGEVL